ncbi:MAG TPA: hypothetical protein PL024_10700 [Thauera sp.]|jgi:hypothetical protein|nr:hypothetical protein [Thauera sp.]HRA81958.1 hypothetical protein [Thauera sp.]
MSIFDSPIGRCEAVKEMVLLDETQRECACEHGCPPGFDCPLAGHFVEVSGLSDETAEALRLAGKYKCMKQAKVAVPV